MEIKRTPNLKKVTTEKMILCVGYDGQLDYLEAKHYAMATIINVLMERGYKNCPLERSYVDDHYEIFTFDSAGHDIFKIYVSQDEIRVFHVHKEFIKY